MRAFEEAKPPEEPKESLDETQGALTVVLRALMPLTPNKRKRVLDATNAFYRVEQ